MTGERLNILSLFSGIGGLELGLERAGMRTVGQVELDPFCNRVLEKHWPEVPRHDDVRTAGGWWSSTVRPRVDVVCGGFPCQPFSTAGLRGGTGDPRWGWPWMESVVRVARPRYVVVENVAELVRDRLAFGAVLSGLASLGFDAEWSVLSACAVGAPHTRERVFVLAHRSVGDGPNEVLPARSGGGVEPGGNDRRAWREWWLREPKMDRVAHGVPRPLVYGELHALGNAVVPQVAEFVGRAVVAHHESSLAVAA